MAGKGKLSEQKGSVFDVMGISFYRNNFRWLIKLVPEVLL